MNSCWHSFSKTAYIRLTFGAVFYGFPHRHIHSGVHLSRLYCTIVFLAWKPGVNCPPLPHCGWLLAGDLLFLLCRPQSSIPEPRRVWRIPAGFFHFAMCTLVPSVSSHDFTAHFFSGLRSTTSFLEVPAYPSTKEHLGELEGWLSG